MIGILIFGFTVVVAAIAGHLAVKAFDSVYDPFVDRMCFRQDAMEQDLIEMCNERGIEPPEWVNAAHRNHGKTWRKRELKMRMGMKDDTSDSETG